MKKQNLEKEIKSLEDKKAELEKKINSLKAKVANESNGVEWVDVPGTDYEVTKNVLYKGKTYREIDSLRKPNEEFITLKILGAICENPELVKELKMDSSSTKDDFFFKQPFPQNDKLGYVAGFCAYSGVAYLDCGSNASYSDSDLGVRFMRKKNKRSKK